MALKTLILAIILYSIIFSHSQILYLATIWIMSLLAMLTYPIRMIFTEAESGANLNDMNSVNDVIAIETETIAHEIMPAPNVWIFGQTIGKIIRSLTGY